MWGSVVQPRSNFQSTRVSVQDRGPEAQTNVSHVLCKPSLWLSETLLPLSFLHAVIVIVLALL